MSSRGRVPLAWRNVTYNPRKFLLSVGGVTFAVLLMFTEVGFLNGILDGQVVLLGKLRADLVLVSASKANMFVAEPFPRERLWSAAADPSVESVSPVYVAMNVPWKHPGRRALRFLRLVAFDPDDRAFADPEVDGRREALKQRDTVLFDRRAAAYFGRPVDGVETELGSRRVRVAGTFDSGVDLPSRGTAITSDRTFLRLVQPGAVEPELKRVEIGLVHLRPGADAGAAVKALRAALPGDVTVLTFHDFLARERGYFLKNTPIGLMFALGVLMGAVVAGFICYQILYADVLDNLGQYATLKAMGYATWAIGLVVLQQALYLGLLGFLAGATGSGLLYRGLSMSTGFRIHLTAGRAGAVLALTLMACAVAALLAAKKPLAADPADAF